MTIIVSAAEVLAAVRLAEPSYAKGLDIDFVDGFIEIHYGIGPTEAFVRVALTFSLVGDLVVDIDSIKVAGIPSTGLLRKWAREKVINTLSVLPGCPLAASTNPEANIDLKGPVRVSYVNLTAINGLELRFSL